MKSGDAIKTLSGETVHAPFSGEHPCFGQRQGWCQNKATWRIEGSHFLLHFCDSCKTGKVTLKGQWVKLDEKP